MVSKTEKKKINDIIKLIKEKVALFLEILQRTMLSMNEFKQMNLISSSSLAICNDCIEIIFKKLEDIKNTITPTNYNEQLSAFQTANNDISTIFKKYGCMNFADLITICFDKNYLDNNSDENNVNIVNILMMLFQPIGYKSINWSNIPINLEEANPLLADFRLVQNANNFQCFPLKTVDNTKLESSGIKLVIHNYEKKNTLVISGIINEISLQCVSNSFIKNSIQTIRELDDDIDQTLIERYINSLTIKDILIHSPLELINNLHIAIKTVTVLKTTPLVSIVKEFTQSSIIEKRNMIIKLLLFENEPDFKYIAYLLYDLLSSDTNNTINSNEQLALYDSLPIEFKKIFKEAMMKTLNYTEELNNFSNNIPIEQQICLLKVNDSVKEKAMVKLKEIKSKSDDTGSKARQYLEGLLRIPFGYYRREGIMNSIPDIILMYNTIIDTLYCDDNKDKHVASFIEVQNNYNSVKVSITKNNNDRLMVITEQLSSGKKNILVKNVGMVNQFIKQHEIKSIKRLSYSNKNLETIKNDIVVCLKLLKQNDAEWNKFMCATQNTMYKEDKILDTALKTIDCNIENVKKYISYVDKTLDTSVYGHTKAKQQIKRIIGQWITGENTGYCFGFEGPPGVGKTSLAKHGIANCLSDLDGTTRPFSFVAIGGSSNGTTFEGHNYTYVGSTWGKIVDILMDSKCMNPIIFIDELDKISKTENGKELIGILTHLIDSSQNDRFQDKYFNGIDIDVSKVLFIFSYNDASIIDRILLDRIHRVKFERLTIVDKIEITKRHLLKEIGTKLCLQNNVIMSDETIRFIINRYTNESGVRKLKEILFEIYSQINLEILENKFDLSTLPIELTKEDIADNYLNDRFKSKPYLIHHAPTVGLINGLWANSMGMGGVLPIESSFIYSTKFMELKLTGMQGDVMKESMNVAKTVAWNILTKGEQEKLRVKMEETKMQGIHIHCPDGATNKDGPSAGTAITMVMYSMLTKKKIKPNVAITGEINLQHKVTAIGGLDLKIIGGIEAGVTEFIYPEENQEDYERFVKKYEKRKEILDGITFHKVENVKQVMKLVFI